jgi:cell wall-associated NlpC family hydrolase
MKYANKGNNNNEDNNNDIENDPDSERLYDKAVRLFGGKGIPYLYGGEDSNGMDCSGLMNATMYDE